MYCVRTSRRALGSQQRPCRTAANREPQKHVRPDGPHRAAHAPVPAPPAVIHTAITPRHTAPVPRPRSSAMRTAAAATIQMEPHVIKGQIYEKDNPCRGRSVCDGATVLRGLYGECKNLYRMQAGVLFEQWQMYPLSILRRNIWDDC